MPVPEKMLPPPPLPIELPDVRAALIRRHWLGVQRFSFQHGYHSTLTTMTGWQCARWADDVSGVQSLTFTPVHAGALASTVGKLVRAMGCQSGEVVADLSMAVDGAVSARLLRDGWRPMGRMFSAHMLPTDGAWRSRLKPLPEGVIVREVTDAKTMADFTAVQELAYRESYGTPEGATSKFYADPHSLIGQDVVGLVLYVVLGAGVERPARSACLIRAEGLVSIANDAAIPEVRGQHLSEVLLNSLLFTAKHQYGCDEVVYVTTPEARSIAARLGVQVVDRYRWMVPSAVAVEG